ncbi:uncharacterized protein ARMOST_21541 [Armillaria ostoyae]|uniref:Uncharacterized protein n=1 Tax=Armillaria ostoyae TaxID=47428 RepID=A0A284SAD2_ARMOS|nr:uncharacterized protein ARMOST_21541 [Armillaria ostoyae]
MSPHLLRIPAAASPQNLVPRVHASGRYSSVRGQTSMVSLQFPLLFDDDDYSPPPATQTTSLSTKLTLAISHASAVSAPAYSDANSRYVHAYSCDSAPKFTTLQGTPRLVILIVSSGAGHA